MDIRAPEAQALSRALATGKLKLQEDGLYMPSQRLLFGKTNQDRFVRYDEDNKQWNVLNSTRTRFDNVRGLRDGETLRRDWPLDSATLLPDLSYWERIKSYIVPTAARTAGFVIMGSFFGTLLHALPAMCGAILGKLPNPLVLMQGHGAVAARTAQVVTAMTTARAVRSLHEDPAAAAPASHTPKPAPALHVQLSGYMPPPDDMMDRVNSDLANLDRMASRHGAASSATCEEQGVPCPPDTRPLFGHGLGQDVVTGVGLGAMVEIATTTITGEGIVSRVATAVRPSTPENDETNKREAA